MVIVSILGLLFGNTAAVKIVTRRPGACDVTSFSPCTDSSHKLGDLQHFMSEEIDLHVFKAITAASCVDNIVNKLLNKYN